MSDAPQQRRLAAIVSIDIAGYSALVENDAAQAFANVTRVRERAESVDQTRALRMDPGFVNLCRRLGLARYWRETGHWPDCVEETAQAYDLKRECRAD